MEIVLSSIYIEDDPHLIIQSSDDLQTMSLFWYLVKLMPKLSKLCKSVLVYIIFFHRKKRNFYSQTEQKLHISGAKGTSILSFPIFHLNRWFSRTVTPKGFKKTEGERLFSMKHGFPLNYMRREKSLIDFNHISRIKHDHFPKPVSAKKQKLHKA